jgi:hypothetical protein
MFLVSKAWSPSTTHPVLVVRGEYAGGETGTGVVPKQKSGSLTGGSLAVGAAGGGMTQGTNDGGRNAGQSEGRGRPT